MIRLVAQPSDGFVAEVYWGFLNRKINIRRSVGNPRSHIEIIRLFQQTRQACHSGQMAVG